MAMQGSKGFFLYILFLTFLFSSFKGIKQFFYCMMQSCQLFSRSLVSTHFPLLGTLTRRTLLGYFTTLLGLDFLRTKYLGVHVFAQVPLLNNNV
jgi:hypothetical protein